MAKTDALRGKPYPSRRKPVQSERYYYTADKLFEQSLDIYRPAAIVAAVKETSPSSPPPVVALVVGSAWLGHRSFIYTGTSWWNSSGPKAVADLGYVCVCIRHRGAFMKTFSILTMAFVALMVAMVASLANAIVDESVWVSLEEMVGVKISLGREGGFLLAVVTGLVLIELGNIGSATFDEMQNDVMDALCWLNDNDERLQLTIPPGQGGNIAGAKTKQRFFVFGGYSSGGHVAATVTQQPHLWKDRNLPPPHIHCDSMLYISPVLSTKSYYEMLLEKISSLPSSSSLPSLTSSDEGSSTGQLSRQSSLTEISVSSSSSKPPTWLTDRVVKVVFGNDVGATIPSPIHTYENSPGIPHIFLGCRAEMFGLNWLDTFFCSASYCDLLNSMGVDSRYTAVKSNHWNILGSAELSHALRNELEWIELESNKDKG